VFGVVDENNTITVTSQLSDGTYTLMYENADGTLEAIGTITVGNGEPVVTYTNLADPTSSQWKQGYRINSSNAYVESKDNTCTNFIPFTKGDIIRVVGMRLAISGISEGGELVAGNSGVGYVRFGISNNGTTPIGTIQLSDKAPDSITVVNGVEIIDTSKITMATCTHFCLVGILEGSADDVIITVNEEIS
jgi:hypothetical protein